MIDLAEIKSSFEFFDDWEDKYQFIIDLGRSLPVLSECQRIEQYIVRGCQSQVWFIPQYDMVEDILNFAMDSDAHIVRGLIQIVRSAYNNRTPQHILDYDIEELFRELDLMAHLVPTRGNGLRAMVHRIRTEAKATQLKTV